MQEPHPSIIAQLARIEEDGKQTRARVEEMDEMLRGSRGDGPVGLITRVDRIEQKEARRDQIGIAVSIAVAISFLTSAWALLTGGKN